MMVPGLSQFSLAEIVLVAAGLILLGSAGVSYMRAVNALSDLIKKEHPRFWPGYYGFFFWVLSGLDNLDVKDARYPGLLRQARQRMIVLLFVFLIFIAIIGWFSHSP